MTPEEVLAWASGAPGRPVLHQTDVARLASHESVARGLPLCRVGQGAKVLIGVIGFAQNPLLTTELLDLLASDNPDLRAEAADSLGKIVGYPPRHEEFREVLQQRLRERIVVEELGWVLSTFLQSLGLVGVAGTRSFSPRSWIRRTDRCAGRRDGGSSAYEASPGDGIRGPSASDGDERVDGDLASEGIAGCGKGGRHVGRLHVGVQGVLVGPALDGHEHTRGRGGLEEVVGQAAGLLAGGLAELGQRTAQGLDVLGLHGDGRDDVELAHGKCLSLMGPTLGLICTVRVPGCPWGPVVRLTRTRTTGSTHDRPGECTVDAAHMGADLERVLVTEDEIQAKLAELAQEIAKEYAGKDLLLVGVLKGAVMVMADLMRALPMSAPVDWMAVSSYGSGTKSSGVVRILKDLDADISGKHVLIVEDIVDSGLTLSWIKANLESRQPASVEIVTLLRKPEAAKVEVDVKWVGFDIPNEFVVGYGLDYAEQYRGLRQVGTLAPHVYS